MRRNLSHARHALYGLRMIIDIIGGFPRIDRQFVAKVPGSATLYESGEVMRGGRYCFNL
jgi:hypothetical protein